MNMYKSLYTYFFLLIAIPLISQENGHLISKTPIPRDTLLHAFAAFPNPERFVVAEGPSLRWNDDWQHLDSLNLFDITYLSDGFKVKGYLLEPRASGKHPCVIFNRGGNRSFGMLTPVRIAFLGGKLASHGYVVIASNYRGVDGGEGMEEFGGADVNDVLNLIPALGQTEKADTSRIGMYGWSRGGMMTYLALTRTDRIKAAVVGGAVSDNFETIRERPDMETHVLAELIPDYAASKEAALTERSAIHWADRFPKNVPVLMLHGNADWRVKSTQSLRLALEFEKHRI
ncbi:MAG: alpha/beta fold hydrolase, partial [Saprospiraceae bacterium]|nr:alpha/beta fold hydrolase [Saprospiraceae bacterium]